MPVVARLGVSEDEMAMSVHGDDRDRMRVVRAVEHQDQRTRKRQRTTDGLRRCADGSQQGHQHSPPARSHGSRGLGWVHPSPSVPNGSVLASALQRNRAIRIRQATATATGDADRQQRMSRYSGRCRPAGATGSCACSRTGRTCITATGTQARRISLEPLGGLQRYFCLLTRAE